MKKSFRWAGALLALSMAAPTYLSARPLGIDVSNIQNSRGSINWTSVKNSGITFAWAKANEGTGFTDSYCAGNISNGKAAGILMGAYDFARPASNTPGAEANTFWSVAGNYIKDDGKTLMPVLDFEDFSGHAGASSYSDWINQWCQAIVSKAAAAGVYVKPVIYISACNTCYLNSSVAQWNCWIANYNGESPQSGTPWDANCTPCELWGSGNWGTWQYSSSMTISGITGYVDADVFNGSYDRLVSTLVATSTSGGGGSVSWKPSSVTYPGGNEEVFAIDTTDNGGVWHAFNSGFGNPWSSGYLDGFSCASALAPVCHGGMMEIFGIGSGGYLQHNWNQGVSTPWNGWSVLQAGSFVGNPAAIARANGSLTVLVHNDSGGSMQEFHQAGTSQPWYNLSLGGAIASDVALVELTNGYVQAFATDTSGFLVNRWDTGPGTAWNNGGWVRIGSGGLEGRPCAVRRPDGGVELFIRKASDHSVTHVYHKLFTDSWTINSLGGTIASNPCGISYANNGVEIFAITSNGQLWHNWNTGGGTAWNGWAGPMTSGCTSDPCVHLNGTANTEVFYRGVNSMQIWHIARAVNGSWSTPSSLGGPQ